MDRRNDVDIFLRRDTGNTLSKVDLRDNQVSVERYSVTVNRLNVLKPTILVVDDEPVVRLMLRDFLEQAGYGVLEASDGLAATESYRADHDAIDLVMLDLELPGMHGLRVLAEMVAIDELVKVIIVSGNKPSEQIAGILAFITKPVPLAKLLETIECALKQRDASACT